MSTAPNRKFELDEYLTLERHSEYKSQFYRGEIFAMPGGTKRHNLMSANVIRVLGNQLINRPCRVYSGDMKLMIEATGLVTYPDAFVACEEERHYDQEEDVLLNPTFLVEVLSPSTESYDRGKKAAHYRKIETLKEYVLIAQDRIEMVRFTRQSNGEWTLAEVDQPGQSLRLESIDCVLNVDEVYAKVKFGPDEETAGMPGKT